MVGNYGAVDIDLTSAPEFLQDYHHAQFDYQSNQNILHQQRISDLIRQEQESQDQSIYDERQELIADHRRWQLAQKELKKRTKEEQERIAIEEHQEMVRRQEIIRQQDIMRHRAHLQETTELNRRKSEGLFTYLKKVFFRRS